MIDELAATPRTDKVAPRLGTSAAPFYGDAALLEQFNRLTVLARQLERELSTARSESAPIREIAAERQRQVEAEGWDAEHDDAHDTGGLAQRLDSQSPADKPSESLVSKLDAAYNKAAYYRCKQGSSDKDAAMLGWIEALEDAWPMMRAALLSARSAGTASTTLPAEVIELLNQWAGMSSTPHWQWVLGMQAKTKSVLLSVQSARTASMWRHVPVACHNLGINFMELQAECEKLAK